MSKLLTSLGASCPTTTSNLECWTPTWWCISWPATVSLKESGFAGRVSPTGWSMTSSSIGNWPSFSMINAVQTIIRTYWIFIIKSILNNISIVWLGTTSWRLQLSLEPRMIRVLLRHSLILLVWRSKSTGSDTPRLVPSRSFDSSNFGGKVWNRTQTSCDECAI